MLQPNSTETSADQILIVENFLPRDICKMLCDHIETEFNKHPITEFAQSRKAYHAKTGEMIPVIRELFYNIMVNKLEPFFETQIEWWEHPQLLRYVKGGRYDPHSDSENWQKDVNGHGYWHRQHDRDVSVVLYLNEEFSGGKLNFPDQNIKITPKPGLLVAFPSTRFYRHGAEPTESGVRYVIVTWAAAVGFPRARDRAPSYVTHMKEFRTNA
jgi:predicted 2-oxoglutarate/Fe(II)-dependent dioxygenase YbiX